MSRTSSRPGAGLEHDGESTRTRAHHSPSVIETPEPYLSDVLTRTMTGRRHPFTPPVLFDRNARRTGAVTPHGVAEVPYCSGPIPVTASSIATLPAKLDRLRLVVFVLGVQVAQTVRCEVLIVEDLHVIHVLPASLLAQLVHDHSHLSVGGYRGRALWVAKAHSVPSTYR